MTPVAIYIAALDKAVKHGDATEHTHRPALQILLQSFDKGIEATNEPQQIAGNAPDYVVRKGPVICGHVEAKNIGEPLDKLLKSDQLKRYREALPNLLFTDYLEFIWIENSEVKLRITLGHYNGKGISAAEDAEEQWKKISQAFFSAITPTVKTPRQLANLLAGQTRLLKNLILDVLRSGDKDLKAQHAAFESTLIPNLKDEEFADMYAQTVAYGLFTARVFDKTPLDFSLHEAESLIPESNPFLRKFFRHISGPDLSNGVRWLIEGIVQLLLHADMEEVIRKQQRKAGFEDPVFHFYETFLAEYDSKLRESRGVYYTPQPVVQFIVRGVDHLLKVEFGRAEGLADPKTLILDPAAGTATFLREVIEHIYRHQYDSGMLGAWPEYVRQNLLPRLFGFELMMAPYTVAHLKLALELKDRGFDFSRNERLHVYLTNTLDRMKEKTGHMLSNWLSEESAGAEAVKNEKPVQVVLGNPPYSGESQNKGEWIEQLLKVYKREPDGSKLKEKNSKWINADEIKFLRFAHWRIQETGHGIAAFVIANNWIDGPTLRGVRAALMHDFDAIYILDLHGNGKKKEKTPSALAQQGSDKNVFDIEQGVAICFLIRHEIQSEERAAKVFHAELWGDRPFKYASLEDTSFDGIPWKEISPSLPQLKFIPQDGTLNEEYQKGHAVTQIFPLNGTGIVTKSDQLNIHWNKEEAWEAVKWFQLATESEARKRFKLPKKEVRDWKFDWAQKDIADSGPSEKALQPIVYRPFDTRCTYYTGRSRGIMGWPVTKVMQHLLDGQNVALSTTRRVETGRFSHAFPVSGLTTHHTVSSKEVNYVFPLWLEPDIPVLKSGSQDDLYAERIRRPNIGEEFLKALAHKLDVPVVEPFGLPLGIAAEDIFHYAYAMLHVPLYRSRYSEFLKSDFPRIPLPSDAQIFHELSRLGERLVDLHLLRAKDLGSHLPVFPIGGDSVVEKPRYTQPKDGELGKVWINSKQHFSGVDPETWAFTIGGYQVLEKWLKDRKGRALNYEDISHYRQVAASLKLTCEVMVECDKAAVSLWP